MANKYIPIKRVPAGTERDRVSECLRYWAEIDDQTKKGLARIYIPDICIAETFKVLAKKYFQERWFKSPQELNNARNRFRLDTRTTTKTLRAATRKIKVHDIPTSRDIIIAVDRFYELFQKYKKNVSIPDLILLATAKYLLDFYDIPKDALHIITLDNPLWEGSKKIQELPNAYNPTKESDACDKVFK